jgi:hypothetical protein
VRAYATCAPDGTYPNAQLLNDCLTTGNPFLKGVFWGVGCWVLIYFLVDLATS